MTGKTHILGGLEFGCLGAIAASVAVPELTTIQVGSFIMGSTVGALIPDIDHPNSVISRQVPVISGLYRVIAALDKGICKFLRREYRMGHRGITHSLVPIGLLLGLLLYFGRGAQIFELLLGLLVGCISHVVFDMLNPSGVPILLPFSDKRFRLVPKRLAIPTKNIVRKKGMANQAWKENAFAVVTLLLDAGLLFVILKGGLKL